MKYIRFYILAAFIAIAVFGFVGLTTPDSLFSKCVEATIPGGMCELHISILPLVKSQIYLSFSLGVLTSFLMLLAALSVWHIQLVQSRLILIGKQDDLANLFNSKNLRWNVLHQQHPGH